MPDDEHQGAPDETKFVRTRDSKYGDRCKGQGYTPTKTHPKSGKILWNAHHILICASLKDARIEPESARPYIRDCFKLTDWDVNKKENLIGLDVKWPYLLHDKYPNQGYTLPENLPCHRIGHPSYNQKVYKYMRENVWEQLQAKKQDHPKGKDIANELDTASDFFKRHLIRRGSDLGGTLICWEKRHEFDKKGIPWFVPFSMGDPVQRAPGPEPGKLKQYSDLFQTVT